MGATPITVSRSGKDGAVTYEEAIRDHGDAAFLINTTPVGMYPHDDGMAIDLVVFPHLQGVADAVYNPLRTPLIRRAKSLGIPAEGGLYMLVAQAVAAYGFFFDTEADVALTDRIYREVASEKENIVLIGMPASGKSTVGKALAESLGRPFYDSDEEIVKEAGMAIPAYFEAYGEAAFRDLESRVMARLSSGLSGAVIATGGGAVLRGENVDRLKANGRLFWLDRSLGKLTPTSDRPLSSDMEALRKRYEERYPIYRAACDCRIDGDGAVEDVAEAILCTFA
jgi:shikimate dehydrogenase